MKKRNRIIIAITLLLLVLIILLLLPRCSKGAGGVPEPEIQPATETDTPVISDPEPDEDPPYESPVDFEKWQARNADVCAWLEIPGTTISYPVVQSATDDSLYIRHDIDKAYDVGGTLFTEHVYNSNDFTDPVTIVYGHHLLSGEMFGNLQQYYTDDFDRYADIVIYKPEEEIHYEVFAAVAFSNRHILYYYDRFQEAVAMEEFLDDLHHVRAIGSYIDPNVQVTDEDRLLVLSTCLQGDRTSRFLVVAKRR